MSIPPDVLRIAIDHAIEALIVLRDEFQRLEQAANRERRLVQQAELAAVFDLDDDDDDDDNDEPE